MSNPFTNLISQFFGFDRDPARGCWPRKVASNELPPKRLQTLPPHLRAKYPAGIIEVSDPASHRGWNPWSEKKQREQNGSPFMDKKFNNYLRDGAGDPPDEKK